VRTQRHPVSFLVLESRPLRTHPAFFPLGPLTSSPERSIMAYAEHKTLVSTRTIPRRVNRPPPSHCQ
jgi:hypothetical protein